MKPRRHGLRRDCYTCENLWVDMEGNPRCDHDMELFNRRGCYRQAKTDEPVMEGQKCCSSCHKVYPAEEFYKDLHFKDGLDCYCRYCRRMIDIDNAIRRDNESARNESLQGSYDELKGRFEEKVGHDPKVA